MFKRLQLFLNTSLQLEDNTALGSTNSRHTQGMQLPRETGQCMRQNSLPSCPVLPIPRSQRETDGCSCKMQDRDHRAAVCFIYAEVTNGALSNLFYPSSPPAAAATTQGCFSRALPPAWCPSSNLFFSLYHMGEDGWLD